MDKRTTKHAMKLFKKNKYRIYKTIDTCPAWNYYKAAENGDNRFLLELNNYDELPDVDARTLMELGLAFDKLSLDIADFELRLSRRSYNLFQLTLRATKLEAEQNQVNNIIKFLSVFGRNKDMECRLNALGYTIRAGKDFEEELKRIFNQNKNKSIKINELKAEINAIAGINAGDKTPIEQIQIAVEKYNKRDIDLKNISIRKWITLKNDLAVAAERQHSKLKK